MIIFVNYIGAFFILSNTLSFHSFALLKKKVFTLRRYLREILPTFTYESLLDGSVFSMYLRSYLVIYVIGQLGAENDEVRSIKTIYN